MCVHCAAHSLSVEVFSFVLKGLKHSLGNASLVYLIVYLLSLLHCSSSAFGFPKCVGNKAENSTNIGPPWILSVPTVQHQSWPTSRRTRMCERWRLRDTPVWSHSSSVRPFHQGWFQRWFSVGAGSADAGSAGAARKQFQDKSFFNTWMNGSLTVLKLWLIKMAPCPSVMRTISSSWCKRSFVLFSWPRDSSSAVEEGGGNS